MHLSKSMTMCLEEGACSQRVNTVHLCVLCGSFRWSTRESGCLRFDFYVEKKTKKTTKQTTKKRKQPQVSLGEPTSWSLAQVCCAKKDLVTHGVLHPAADCRLTIDEPRLQTNKLTNPERHLKKTPLLTHLASHSISVKFIYAFTHTHMCTHKHT